MATLSRCTRHEKNLMRLAAHDAGARRDAGRNARPKLFLRVVCRCRNLLARPVLPHFFLCALTLTREKHLDSFARLSPLRRELALLPNPNPRSTPPFPPGVRPPVALAGQMDLPAIAFPQNIWHRCLRVHLITPVRVPHDGGCSCRDRASSTLVICKKCINAAGRELPSTNLMSTEASRHIYVRPSPHRSIDNSGVIGS